VRLASNTSFISITSLGAATGRPDKVLGMLVMSAVPVYARPTRPTCPA
jgi:3-hydroxyacyl-CoA dehydrogenase